MTRRTESLKTPLTPMVVENHLARGDFAPAAVAARKLHQEQPSPDHLALYRRVLVLQLRFAIDRTDAVEFDRLFQVGRTLGAEEAWQTDLAMLEAGFGRLPQALMSLPANAGEVMRRRAVAHAADWAMRANDAAALPEEHLITFQAIRGAFADFERGDDEAARAKLQTIGLQSPFLEWKLLLRGLMAWHARDDARAIENWSRLSPDRLPWRLAALLRVSMDGEFRAGLSGIALVTVADCRDRLLASPAREALQALHAVVGQAKPLAPGWPRIEAAAAALRSDAPDLYNRFARQSYLAILRQGQPGDLPKYRKLFGTPADDPDFHRLQAMALDSQGLSAQALEYWENYERWLATRPAAWSEAECARARALVFETLASISRQLENGGGEDLFAAFEMLMKRKRPAAKPHKSPRAYYQAAMAADPTAISPHLAYVHDLEVGPASEELVAAAKAALELQPDHPDMLDALATCLSDLARHGEALGVFFRLRAVNPLEPEVDLRTSYAVLAAAREAMIAGRLSDAEKLLDEHRTLLEDRAAFLVWTLWSTLLMKTRRAVEAAEWRAKAAAIPGARLVVAYQASVDAGLAKLSATAKSAAKKAFADALQVPATLDELLLLVALYRTYIDNGIRYSGQKSFERSIEGKLTEIVNGGVARQECGKVCTLFESLTNRSYVLNACAALRLQHPVEPRLLLASARTHLARGDTRLNRNRALNDLLIARRLLQQSTDPERDRLMEEIERVMARTKGYFNFSFQIPGA